LSKPYPLYFLYLFHALWMRNLEGEGASRKGGKKEGKRASLSRHIPRSGPRYLGRKGKGGATRRGKKRGGGSQAAKGCNHNQFTSSTIFIITFATLLEEEEGMERRKGRKWAYALPSPDQLLYFFHRAIEGKKRRGGKRKKRTEVAAAFS